MKNFLIIILIVLGFAFFVNQNDSDWYFPSWAKSSKYNQPIKVLDTESALGRYSKQTKKIHLKDLAKIHGHLCDGLVISFIEIKAVLEKLFPDGVFDRTDLRVVSKNGPCWVDAASMMTGARINFSTLSIQPEVGNGFIIQKISTKEAYSVHLKDGVFPEELAALEKKIRKASSEGEKINPKDIDKAEQLANNLSKKLLNTSPEKLLDIKKLDNYQYGFKFQSGKRGDVINKNMPEGT